MGTDGKTETGDPVHPLVEEAKTLVQPLVDSGIFNLEHWAPGHLWRPADRECRQYAHYAVRQCATCGLVLELRRKRGNPRFWWLEERRYVRRRGVRSREVITPWTTGLLRAACQVVGGK